MRLFWPSPPHQTATRQAHSFSDIFGLQVPCKSMDNDNDITGPHTERLNGAQPDQPCV